MEYTITARVAKGLSASGGTDSKEIGLNSRGKSYYFYSVISNSDLQNLAFNCQIKSVKLKYKAKMSRSNSNLNASRANVVGIKKTQSRGGYFTQQEILERYKSSDDMAVNSSGNVYNSGLLGGDYSTYTFDIGSNYNISFDTFFDSDILIKWELYAKCTLNTEVYVSDVSLEVVYTPPKISIGTTVNGKGTIKIFNSKGTLISSSNGGSYLDFFLSTQDESETLTVECIPDNGYKFNNLSLKYKTNEEQNFSTNILTTNKSKSYIFASSAGVTSTISGKNDYLGDYKIEVTFDVVYYTVTFMGKNSGGNWYQLQSKSNYRYGDAVTTPSFTTTYQDVQWTYYPNGWTPEVTNVTKDVVYYANYPDDKRILRYYSVKWLDEDGTTVLHNANLGYGTAINESVSKPSDKPSGKFLQWTPSYTPGQVIVYGDTNFTAVYQPSEITIKFIDGDGGGLKSVTYTWDSSIGGVRIENSVINEVENFSKSKASSLEYDYQYDKWLNSDGFDLHGVITFSTQFVQGYKQGRRESGTFVEGETKKYNVKMYHNDYVGDNNFHYVQISYGAEVYSFLSNDDLAKINDEYLSDDDTINHTYNKSLKSYTISDGNKTDLSIFNETNGWIDSYGNILKAIMPVYKLSYKVTFVNYDDSVVYEEFFENGKYPSCTSVPAQPDTMNDDGTRTGYNFKGWKESATNKDIYLVNKSTTYVAQFEQFYRDVRIITILDKGIFLDGYTKFEDYTENPKSYTVILGDGCSIDSLSIKYTQDDTELVKDTDYTLTSNKLTLNKIIKGITITIVGKYTPLTYSFVYRDVVYYSGEANYGTIINTRGIRVPSKNNEGGYIWEFSRWYNEDDVSGDSGLRVTKSNTIFAPVFIGTKFYEYKEYEKKLNQDRIEQFKFDEDINGKGRGHVFNILDKAFSRQLDDLYNFFYQILVVRRLSEASGIQLDRIGDIVGLSREEASSMIEGYGNPILDDDAYRDRLKYKIMMNVSVCTYEDVVTSIRMLTNDNPFYYHEDNSIPATIRMYYDYDNMDDDEREKMEEYVNKVVNSPLVRASGVNLEFIRRNEEKFNSDIYAGNVRNYIYTNKGGNS